VTSLKQRLAEIEVVKSATDGEQGGKLAEAKEQARAAEEAQMKFDAEAQASMESKRLHDLLRAIEVHDRKPLEKKDTDEIVAEVKQAFQSKEKVEELEMKFCAAQRQVQEHLKGKTDAREAAAEYTADRQANKAEAARLKSEVEEKEKQAKKEKQAAKEVEVARRQEDERLARMLQHAQLKVEAGEIERRAIADVEAQMKAVKDGPKYDCEWPQIFQDTACKVFDLIASHCGEGEDIDKAELIAAWHGVHEQDTNLDIFDQIDDDGTGTVGLSEWIHFLRTMREEREREKEGSGDFWFKVFMSTLESNIDDVVNGAEYETSSTVESGDEALQE